MIEPQNRKRRWVAVAISLPFLQEMFTTGYRFNSKIYVQNGLPEGAKYIGAFYNSMVIPPDAYYIFEHESFDEVEEGAVIPRKSVVFCCDGKDA